MYKYSDKKRFRRRFVGYISDLCGLIKPFLSSFICSLTLNFFVFCLPCTPEMICMLKIHKTPYLFRNTFKPQRQIEQYDVLCKKKTLSSCCNKKIEGTKKINYWISQQIICIHVRVFTYLYLTTNNSCIYNVGRKHGINEYNIYDWIIESVYPIWSQN